MRDLLLLGLLGTGIGGLYAMLGTGVVVGHKGSGLINLDQGALAMFPAYTYVTMRESGEVYFPWFDFVPGPVDVPVRMAVPGGPVDALPALAAGIAMSLLLGALMQALVFGPLRNQPPISKIIGSLGALLYLTSVALSHFGARARTVDGVLPDGAWENPFGLGGQVPYSRLSLAAIALATGAGLALYFRVSRLGLSTRAVENSELGAALLGYSPNRIAALNWLISTTVTGLGGILALEFLSLTPTRYTLFVVPALGAALVGNLTSTWLAAVGGVAIGIFQSSAAGLTLEPWWPDWLPQAGMRQVVPLLVIVAFQFVRGDTLPVRSSVVVNRQPRAPMARRWRAQVIGVVLVTAWLVTTGSRVTEGKLAASLIAASLMLSLVVITGYLGQVSLANAAFAGVSAYLTTKFAADGSRIGTSPFVLDGLDLPDPLAAALGIGVAVLVGLLLALPALRIRGMQLAVVTLAFAVAATALVMGNEALMGQGARSNVTVPPPTWFGMDVGVTADSTGAASRSNLVLFSLSWLVVLIAAVAGIRGGSLGRRLLAVRANERSAAAVGVDIVRTKLLGFGISAAIAGVAGVLTAYNHTVLQITTWDALSGISTVALVFLGGIGSIGGALLGGALAPGGLLSDTSGEGEVLRTAVSGAVMIAIAIFQPDGLVSLGRRVADRFTRARRTLLASQTPTRVRTQQHQSVTE